MFKNSLKIIVLGIVLSANLVPIELFSSMGNHATATHGTAHVSGLFTSKNFLQRFFRPVLRPDLVVRKHPFITLGAAGLVTFGLVGYYAGLFRSKDAKNVNKVTPKTFYEQGFESMKNKLIYSAFFLYVFINPNVWTEFIQGLDKVPKKIEQTIPKKTEQTKEQTKEQKKQEVVQPLLKPLVNPEILQSPVVPQENNKQEEKIELKSNQPIILPDLDEIFKKVSCDKELFLKFTQAFKTIPEKTLHDYFFDSEKKLNVEVSTKEEKKKKKKNLKIYVGRSSTLEALIDLQCGSGFDSTSDATGNYRIKNILRLPYDQKLLDLYDPLISLFLSTLIDAPYLIMKKSEEIHQGSLLDIILGSRRLSTLKTYLQVNQGFKNNIYHKKTNTLTLNIEYIGAVYDKNDNINFSVNNTNLPEYLPLHELIQQVGPYPCFMELFSYIQKNYLDNKTDISKIKIEFVNSSGEKENNSLLVALLNPNYFMRNDSFTRCALFEVILQILMNPTFDWNAFSNKISTHPKLKESIEMLATYINNYYVNQTDQGNALKTQLKAYNDSINYINLCQTTLKAVELKQAFLDSKFNLMDQGTGKFWSAFDTLGKKNDALYKEMVFSDQEHSDNKNIIAQFSLLKTDDQEYMNQLQQIIAKITTRYVQFYQQKIYLLEKRQEENKKSIQDRADRIKTFDIINKLQSLAPQERKIKNSEPKIKKKKLTLTYNDVKKLIIQYDIEALTKLAKNDKKTLITLFTQPSPVFDNYNELTGHALPLIHKVFDTIFSNTMGLGNIKDGVTIRFYANLFNNDQELVKQKQEALIDFVSDSLSIDLGAFKWYQESKGLLTFKTVSAMTLAIANHYVPLIDYLLQKYKSCLFDKIDNNMLLIHLESIFSKDALRNNYPFFYEFLNDHKPIQKTKIEFNRTVPAIGIFPCFAAIIDQLKTDNVDLAKVTLPLFKDHKCPIIACFLYFLKDADDFAIERPTYVAMFETILKIYRTTNTLGSMNIPGLEKKELSGFITSLQTGLEYLEKYLEEHPLLPATLNNQLKNDITTEQKKVTKALKILKEEKESKQAELKEITLKAVMSNKESKKLYTLFEVLSKEDLYAYFFGDKKNKLSLKERIKKTKFLATLLTYKPINTNINQKKYTNYEQLVDFIVKNLTDKPTLLSVTSGDSVKMSHQVSMLDLILLNTKISTLEAYLNSNKGFTKNIYNQKKNNLTLNLYYILNIYQEMKAFTDDLEKVDPTKLTPHMLMQQIGMYPCFIKLFNHIQNTSFRPLNQLALTFTATNKDDDTVQYTCPVAAALLYEVASMDDNFKTQSILELILQIFIESAGKCGSIKLSDTTTLTNNARADFYSQVSEGLQKLRTYTDENYIKKETDTKSRIKRRNQLNKNGNILDKIDALKVEANDQTPKKKKPVKKIEKKK